LPFVRLLSQRIFHSVCSPRCAIQTQISETIRKTKAAENAQFLRRIPPPLFR
jgi:hypothetical protein